MFIDDNPLNLEEVSHLIPEIHIRSHEFIGDILATHFLSGKDDVELRRLNQYRLLEKRKADEGAASGDLTSFLRSSNIRVRFDHDVMGNLDRAVELINRTNQLNFTKQRLPEDFSKAREELPTLISSHEVRVALVGVRDNYDDHGWCGIYILHNNGNCSISRFPAEFLVCKSRLGYIAGSAALS
jgi:predicted enzyme involved in methoxymalonyl-ACP biosynthesis